MEHTSNKTSGGSMKNRHSATLIRMQEFFRAVQEQLEQEWTSFHTFKSCPVFFNITNFHLFNAAYGIEKGDACLQHIAMLLQQHFPKKLITHLGADHFAVLADTADVEISIR